MIDFTNVQRAELYQKDVDVPFFCAAISKKVSPSSRCEKCYANNREQWFECWILID